MFLFFLILLAYTTQKMHAKKRNLHLVLSRFDVPMELRVIIIEDYFPFFTEDSQELTYQSIRFLFCDFMYMIRLSNINCTSSLYLICSSIKSSSEEKMFKVCHVGYSLQTNCKGYCHNRPFSLQSCGESFSLQKNFFYVDKKSIHDDNECQSIIDWCKHIVLNAVQ